MVGGWHRVRHSVRIKYGPRLLQSQMERFAAISNGHRGHTHRHSDHCRILHAHAYHFGCETFHEYAKFQAKPELYVGPGASAHQFLQLHYICGILVAVCHRTVLSYNGWCEQAHILYDRLDWNHQIVLSQCYLLHHKSPLSQRIR